MYSYDELTELLDDAYTRLQLAQRENDDSAAEHIEAEISELEAERDELDLENEYEYDGQPDELTEWMDFDPDC